MHRSRLLLLLAASGTLTSGCGSAPQATREVELHDVARAHQGLRPDTPGGSELWRFAPGDEVERYETTGGNFVVHYTREGPHAVPSRDADEDGVPDHVQEVGALYEDVLAFYTGTLGFRAPLDDEGVLDGNGGDGRYDVYLLDFNFSADGAFRTEACLNAKPSVCTGYMVQENDFAGYGYPSAAYANRLLASHEFFHFVQAAYDGDQGTVLSEGTAVWASEKLDPNLFDLEGFSDGFLSNPDRSLNVPQPGPVDRYSYGSGVFFQFLEERYSRDAIRALWEGVEDGAAGIADPDWFDDVLDDVLAEHGATFEDMYLELVRWNLYTGPHADPTVSYDDGHLFAPVALEVVTAPHVDERLRVFYASAQYFAATPDARDEMTAALVGDDADLADLHLLLATLEDGKVATLVDADLQDAEVTLNTADADAFIAIVVNTAKRGDSRRPGLCIGAPDEVEACRADLGAAPADGDAGVGDGGDDGDGDALPPGCGCSGAALDPTWAALFMLAGLVRLTRGRKR